MNKGVFALAVFGFGCVSGCASITGDTVQVIRVETRLADGTEVRDADCELVNKKGTYRVKSPGSVTVWRSATDLNISCKKNEQADAKGKAVSGANGGMFGNIILGGVVGAVVDHSRGSGYTYPQWVQLVFGRFLTFERNDNSDGQTSPLEETGLTKGNEADRPVSPSTKTSMGTIQALN